MHKLKYRMETMEEHDCLSNPRQCPHPRCPNGVQGEFLCFPATADRLERSWRKRSDEDYARYSWVDGHSLGRGG